MSETGNKNAPHTARDEHNEAALAKRTLPLGWDGTSYKVLAMNRISSDNSTTTLLTASTTFTGEWEDVTDYNTVSVAVLGSLATDGCLFFDLSTDNGSTFTSVPAEVSDATFSVPRILNVVERYVRIRYVNGTTAMTGTFSLTTKYAIDQQMSLLSPLDGLINSENPATLVRPGTDFDLDVARKHIVGQRSFFFFGYNDAVGTSWVDIHPNGGDINWLQAATKVEIVSSDTNDNGTTPGTGLLSVEVHGLSATGVDQDEVILTDGTAAVQSTLDYVRVNKMHSEFVGTYGGSHEGNITCRVTGGGATMSLMKGIEGTAGASGQYGLGEAGNGYWSVPLGKVLYITRLEVITDVVSNKTIDIALYERDCLLDVTTPFCPRRVLWKESGVKDNIIKEFKSHIKIKALSDIWFRAKTSTGSSLVEVSLDFYLVDADSSGA